MKMETSKSFVEDASKLCNEPEWLRQFRSKSFDVFKSLPIEQSQMFLKYVEDENRFNFDNVNFDYRLLLMEEAEADLGPENSILTTSSGIKKNVKLVNKSFIFTDMLSAVKTHPEIKDLILKSTSEDKMSALNNSMFNSGVFIYVPMNTKITVPMRSIFLLDKPNSVIFNRTTIFVDRGSSLNFVEEVYSNESTGCLYSENLEVFVKDNSSVNLVFLQNSGKETENLINRSIFSNGLSSAFSLNFGGKLTRYRIECYLNHDGAELVYNDIFFGNSEQKLDMFSRLIHSSPNTQGKFTTKAILKDKSEALFKGMIKILKDAKNTQAYLSDHSMMLSKECKSNSIPSLEIETDSVKATHSASTQQLDREHIFYLMSRGLTEEQAKKTIALGFLEPVIRVLPSKSLIRSVEAMIEDKWNNVESETNITDLSDYSESVEKTADIFTGHYKYR